MNEVSTVASLINRLIVYAIALGAAGTLMDQVFHAKADAQNVVQKGGISYSKWNRVLIERNSNSERR